MKARQLPLVLAAVAAAALMLMLGGTASSYAPAPTPAWVVSGGTSGAGQLVTSVAVSGSTAYIGGDFSYVGPETGSFVGVDTGSSALVAPWPVVGGNVYATAPDGSGGWFVGGLFSSIGTKHADNLAHINADGTLDTGWAGSVSGTVYSIVVTSSTVFVGGAFSTAGGAPHTNLAAFDKTSGAVSAGFTTNATGTGAFVSVLRLSGSTIYVGGKFTLLGADAHTNLGAVSTSGVVQPWTPSTDDIVYALAVGASGTVYAGGNFLHVNDAVPRDHVAAFNAAGKEQNWEPDADGPVYALEYSDSGSSAVVYAAGAFGLIGLSTRSGLGAVQADPTSDGDATSWNPKVNGQVFQIALSADASTIYAGGRFDKVNDTVGRDNVAAFSTSGTGAATNFWSVVGGEVDALAVSGSTVALGGEFRSAGGGNGTTPGPLRRSNLAAIDLTSGQATAWNPRTNDAVEVVGVSGSRVYAGGEFTLVNGTIARDRLAAFDLNVGNATNWNPGVHNGGVFALAFSGTTVYAGGSFNGATAVSANPPAPRNRAAAFNADGVGNGFGDLLPWDPNVSIANSTGGAVFALDIVGDTAFVGGNFNRLRNTVVRNNLAAVPSNPSAAAVPANWDPNVNDSVFALAHAGASEYAGGPFTAVNGGTVSRRGAAAFDVAGNATSWNPQVLFNATTTGSVFSLAPSASSMYLSGIFRTVGGFLTPSVAAVSLATGAPNTTWAPGADDLVSSIALSPQGLVLGGQFTALGFPPPGTQPVNPDEPAATYHGGFALVRALPDAPSNVTATQQDSSVTVSFGAPPSNGGAAITSYTATQSPGGVTMTGAGPFTFTGLSIRTTYTFTVTATTSAGTGEPAVATVTLEPPAPPPPVERPAVPDIPPITTPRPPPPHHG
jgi:hypothetical protein